MTEMQRHRSASLDMICSAERIQCVGLWETSHLENHKTSLEQAVLFFFLLLSCRKLAIHISPFPPPTSPPPAKATSFFFSSAIPQNEKKSK